MQTSQAKPARQVVAGEDAPNHRLAIRLQGDRIDSAIGPFPRIESQVKCAVSIQPSHRVAAAIVQIREESAKDDLVVGLNRQTVDRTVGAAAGVEGAIEGTVAVKARHAAARNTVEAGEL